MRVEHEYDRRGALAYLAAWDVHHARVFGRCEPTTGIEPFGRLVAQVMTVEPYASAHRVFWIVDNGSSHRGQAAVKRLEGTYHNLCLIHLPVHASWLNQVEIYCSVVQRKVLTPTTFKTLPRSGSACSASSTATSRPHSPSTGSTPALTWIAYCAASTSTSNPPSRHELHTDFENAVPSRRPAAHSTVTQRYLPPNPRRRRPAWGPTSEWRFLQRAVGTGIHDGLPLSRPQPER
jgi:hypothetical protein